MASASVSVRRARGPLASNLSADTNRTSLERSFAFVCFTIAMAANVVFFAPRIGGIPVRSILSAGMLGCFALFYTEEMAAVIRKYWLLLVLAAGLAIQGAFVSAFNGAPMGETARALLEVHFQTVVIFIVTGTLARICGPRACVLAILLVIGTSAVVAVLQTLHLNVAWAMRRALGAFATDEFNPNIADHRPTGLSFSPIQLSTQLCVAFAAFTAVRDAKRRNTPSRRAADPFVIGALFALIAASVATGTRSPILGAVIFLAPYLALRRGSWVPLLLLLGGAMLYFVWPLVMTAVQHTAPRVARVDDKSAAARWVFAYFGTRLFLDNPFGYGLTFEPSAMWAAYWPDLYMMRGAQGAQVRDLHNYGLSMLNMYGIGILLFVPIVAKLLRTAGPALIFFIPYVVHIMFHNSGPFYNDMILWFAVAAIAAVDAPTTFNNARNPAGQRVGAASRKRRLSAAPGLS